MTADGQSVKPPHHASRIVRRPHPLPQREDAIEHHVLEAGWMLLGAFQRGVVAHLGWVEDDDIRRRADLQPAARRQSQTLGRQRRDAADRLLQRQHASVTHIVAQQARSPSKAAQRADHGLHRRMAGKRQSVRHHRAIRLLDA
jgi:hypothetical protein